MWYGGSDYTKKESIMVNGRKAFFASMGSKFLFTTLCLLLIVGQYKQHNSKRSISPLIEQAIAIDVNYDGTCPSIFVNMQTIDAYDDNGWTALMKAALQGDICQAENLIKNGANLDLRSKNIDPRTNAEAGNTALHFALYMLGKGSNNLRVGVDAYRVVALALIDAGADLYVTNNMGETAIHFAIQIINLDVQGIQYDIRAAMIEKLIKGGADINAQNNNGETYTHLSVRNLERNWMVTLKDYFGSIVNFSIKNRAGQTPHDLAINLGFTDVRDNLTLPAKIIGATDVTERDIMGMNGAMLATIRQDVPFLDKMIGRGIDINAKTADQDGNNVLHIALLHQKINMVKILLDRGANPNQPNAFLDFPLHYILKISPWSSSNFAKMRNDAARLFLDNNNKFGPANVNAVNDDGNTVLHLAVLTDAKEFVEFLINPNNGYASRVNPFIRNGKYGIGKTPLQLAQDFQKRGQDRKTIIKYLEALELSKQFIFSVQPK